MNILKIFMYQKYAKKFKVNCRSLMSFIQSKIL